MPSDSSVDLPASFERHLRAENKSARTVETYLEAVQQLDAFLAVRGVDLAGARRADIEAYLAGLLARWKPATAANRYPAPCRSSTRGSRTRARSPTIRCSR
jgi:site-specific recombinase XerD